MSGVETSAVVFRSASTWPVWAVLSKEHGVAERPREDAEKAAVVEGREFSQAIQVDCSLVSWSLFPVLCDGRHSPASTSPAIILLDGVPR